MKLRATLAATAAAASSLVLAVSPAPAAPAGDGAPASSPVPAFSYCESSYSPPYQSGDQIIATGSITCNGPDPRNGQPLPVDLQFEDGGLWFDLAHGVGRVTYDCWDDGYRIYFRTKQLPDEERYFYCV